MLVFKIFKKKFAPAIFEPKATLQRLQLSGIQLLITGVALHAD